MTSGKGAEPGSPVPNDPSGLREDIEQTREELAGTAEALLSRADVRSRAQDKVRDLRGRASEKA